MSNGIPPKKVSSEEAMKKKRRLYVEPTREDHLRFQEEAFNRDMAPHDLGGILINLWINAGCPDHIVSATQLAETNC
ncbi:hypothetical protein [Endozoicomonas acroporae]|uniref:hypothetical protein n=1 Tax=Endozoicomonas acroporae TaxID=1701104 RepID=UPI003D79E3AA